MEGNLTSPLRCYYDLERPEGFARRRRWPLLIALHGYEGNKESMMRVALRITNGGMLAIAMPLIPTPDIRRMGSRNDHPILLGRRLLSPATR